MSYEFSSGHDASLRTSSAVSHLNASGGENYLNAINGIRPEDIMDTRKKLAPLLHVPQLDTVVVVGVGNGAEPIALEWLLKDIPERQIIGLDISEVALAYSVAKTARFGYGKISYTAASCTELPFADNSLSALTFSAVLHEVYSYIPDGNKAVKATMSEVARTLKPNGAVLIRDFAHPEITDDVVVEFRHKRGQEFYEYFRESWRQFLSWDDNLRQEFTRPELLPGVSNDGTVILSPALAGEMLLHYRNFYNDWTKGITDLNDQSWKEMQEAYFPKLTKPDGTTTETQTQYIAELIDSMQASTPESAVTVTSHTLAGRPDTATFLDEYFTVYSTNNGRTVDMNNFTRKTELLLSKVPSSDTEK